MLAFMKMWFKCINKLKVTNFFGFFTMLTAI